MRDIPHFIDGAAVAGTGEMSDVFDPATGAAQARVAMAGAGEADAAVVSARAAQPEWEAMGPQRRARVLADFLRLVERDMDAIALLLSREHGKTVADSKGEIRRGLDVIEFCAGAPQILKGEHSQRAGPGIDAYALRQPLGVAAGITPFNFPAMIPMWMLGPALAAGNAFVLKPSEQDPSVPVRLAELMIEAGAPAGVLNVLHGGKAAVEALVAHPGVDAVSFVGSSDIAAQVYASAAAHGKRVQAMGGAKNHGVVLPDADIGRAAAEIAGAAFGSAGERCMAMPVAVPVGERTAGELREALLAEIGRLRVGLPTDSDADFGPVVSARHRDRIHRYIQMGAEEGAELVVDGRGFTLQGYENGFFVGPTLFDRVTQSMQAYRDEIFGPVLQIVRAETFEAALALVSAHPYGNGASVFTRDGGAARAFARRVEAGMVGINVPIPVPVAYHSFGGWKRSAFGDLNQYGMDGIRFYTRGKTVTERWPGEDGAPGSAYVMPQSV